MSEDIRPAAIAELEALYATHANGGLDRFAKVFAEFVERWALRKARPDDDRFALRRCATRFYRGMVAVAQSRSRAQQLRDGGFAFWVYRVGDQVGCGAEHGPLDGVVLPPDHPFWKRYAPPTSPECGCYLNGARSERGAMRLGGDPGKPLPEWWRQDDPGTGLPVRTEWPFVSASPPDVETLLRWALGAEE